MPIEKKMTIRSGKVLVIRPYVVSDYPSVKQNLKDTKLFDEVWDSEESLTKMIQQDPETILVGVLDNTVVANVYVQATGHWAFLWHLATRSKYQEQGIATALQDAALELLNRRGIPQVAIFVNDSDRKLKAFYAKRGWNPRGAYQAMWRETKE